jgi:DNA-binding NarL/FixJ family response regulator
VNNTTSTVIEPPLQNSLLSTLTESELAVLRLMRKGVRNKDIAAALFVSLRTVEVRITQIYRKLEARSRSHLLTLLPADLDQIESF